MSKPVRVAFVVEGDTDLIMLEAIVGTLLPERQLVITLLQPQDSHLLNPAQLPTPGGWPGVYHWCRQTRTTAGSVRQDPLFDNHDLLVLQIDADIAGLTYRQGHINDDPATDLPNSRRDCPPPSATVNALRAVLLRWMGEPAVPPRTVLCIPSKALETWVAAALYPADAVVRNANLECRANPQTILSSKPQRERLMSGNKKHTERYQDRSPDVAQAWPNVRVRCPEAERFSVDFLAVVPPPD